VGKIYVIFGGRRNMVFGPKYGHLGKIEVKMVG
jgi:hypothetical protein